VLTLQRRQVDLAAGTLRLKPGTTKNDDGRVVYLTSKLKSLLAAQLERVRALVRELGRYPPTSSHTCHQGTGKASIKDFHKAWQAACRKASCPELLKHDLRRTAVRNMVNLGVPERVAMKITGHRTRSVFDRYHIVAPVDLQNAARRLSDSAGTI